VKLIILQRLILLRFVILKIIHPIRKILMQVNLSGRTGRITSTSTVPRKDGSGYFQISDTSLAVKVAEDVTDWYQLKFIGDSLVKAASYLTKGCQISLVGSLTFEHWNNEDGDLCARPVVTVFEIQLPAKVSVAV
jgi:single-stranded DNA-binding protein